MMRIEITMETTVVQNGPRDRNRKKIGKEAALTMEASETKRTVAAICKQLDHRFLLPRKSRSLEIEERDGEYEIAFSDRRYVLPESDVAALPIDNSTAERLAEWLNGRIRAALSASGASNIGRVTVGVEEAPGQVGWFTSDTP